jgi:hypothetical protein
MNMVKRLILVLGIVVAVAVGGIPAAASADYSRSGAETRTREWAESDWGSIWDPYTIFFCNGPYEHVAGKTEWACGGQEYRSNSWQVNIGPNGNQLYHSLS